jgi:hypothetical protein
MMPKFRRKSKIPKLENGVPEPRAIESEVPDVWMRILVCIHSALSPFPLGRDPALESISRTEQSFTGVTNSLDAQ